MRQRGQENHSDTAQGYILAQLRELMGEEGTIAVQYLLTRAIDPAKNTVVTIAGVLTFILGRPRCSPNCRVR